MALTTNEWNTVTFQLLSNAAWSTVPADGLSQDIAQAVRDTTDVRIFVLDDTDPIQFTYLGAGTRTYTYPAAVFLSESPEVTNVQTIDSSGDIWYSMREALSGYWIWYSANSGTVSQVDNPAALAAFLA